MDDKLKPANSAGASKERLSVDNKSKLIEKRSSSNLHAESFGRTKTLKAT